MRAYSKPADFGWKHSLWRKFVDWAMNERGTLDLVRPFAMAVDSKGRLIVADAGARDVKIFDPQQGLLTERRLGSASSGLERRVVRGTGVEARFTRPPKELPQGLLTKSPCSTIISVFPLPFCRGPTRQWKRRARAGPGLARLSAADSMTEHPAERRHFRRMPVQIPVVLRGKDSSGRDFFDRAEVVSIDERGARVHTRFLLNVGAEATVELPGEKTLKRMRVVWRGEAEGFYAGMIGLEFVDQQESWDLENLKVRWGARNY